MAALINAWDRRGLATRVEPGASRANVVVRAGDFDGGQPRRREWCNRPGFCCPGPLLAPYVAARLAGFRVSVSGGPVFCSHRSPDQPARASPCQQRASPCRARWSGLPPGDRPPSGRAVCWGAPGLPLPQGTSQVSPVHNAANPEVCACAGGRAARVYVVSWRGHALPLRLGTSRTVKPARCHRGRPAPAPGDEPPRSANARFLGKVSARGRGPAQ